MELRQIIQFLEIVRTGKLSDAATNLFISQPALTTSIKKLEEELDVKLFYRNHKGFVLTEAGQVFAEHARKAITELDRASEAMRNWQTGASRPLEIGVPSVSCGMVYPMLYNDFHNEYPEISFTVNDIFSYDSVKKVKDEELEVSFCIYRGEHPDEISFIPVASGEIMILVKADEKTTKMRSIPVDNLKDRLWIFNRRANSRQTTTELMVMDYFRNNNIDIPLIKYIEDHHTILNTVSMGIGIYPYPNTSSSNPFKDSPGTVSLHLENSIRYQIGLVYKKNHKLSASAAKMVHWFKNYEIN